MLLGLPKVCGITIALTSWLTAFFKASSLTLYVPISMSTNTGFRLFCIIGANVVGKVAAGVITLSPVFNGFGILFDFKAVTAIRLAEEPEFVSTENFEPTAAANSLSNCIPLSP